jgi:hypothetical protein
MHAKNAEKKGSQKMERRNFTAEFERRIVSELSQEKRWTRF